MTIEDLKYISRPVTNTSPSAPPSTHNTTSSSSAPLTSSTPLPLPTSSQEGEGVTADGGDHIAQFNVILTVIRESVLQRLLSRCRGNAEDTAFLLSQQDHHLYCSAEGASNLRSLMEMFAMGLLHEERRSSYVARQVKIMISCELLLLPTPTNTHQNASSSSSSTAVPSQEGNPSSFSPNSRNDFVSPKLPSEVNLVARDRSVSNAVLASFSSRDRAESSTAGGRDRSYSNATIHETTPLPISNAMSSSYLTHATENQVTVGLRSAEAISHSLFIMETKLRQSTLANELRTFYHDLVGETNSIIFVTVN